MRRSLTHTHTHSTGVASVTRSRIRRGSAPRRRCHRRARRSSARQRRGRARRRPRQRWSPRFLGALDVVASARSSSSVFLGRLKALEKASSGARLTRNASMRARVCVKYKHSRSRKSPFNTHTRSLTLAHRRAALRPARRGRRAREASRWARRCDRSILF